MGYMSTLECVKDLEKHGMLIRVSEEVDPDQEMAEIHRRVYEEQGPAILFENVKGSPFPAVCNLYGTLERIRFIFRDTLEDVEKILKLKLDPSAPLKSPLKFAKLLPSMTSALPKKISPKAAPVFKNKTTIDQLPATISWPDDGGRFVTLPQVYSEGVNKKGAMNSNLGMYRIQLTGDSYELNKEIGLHYQIHRGIAQHQKEHIEAGKDFKVSIFVGGPPANTFCAVLPLPEGMPEVAFAGLMNGKRFRYAVDENFNTLAADADFCIVGTIPADPKPEGPFGDHLGYYSLTHDFPYMKVDAVYHRDDAIWPFTTVGRPPQEDTSFGDLIHELTGPLLPSEIHGLKAIHAVDAAGVHPLLLATARDNYTPYKKKPRPQELLTVANSILGKGQLSLAKYLFILDEEDDPELDIHHVDQFLDQLLRKIDLSRDLHFQTQTTIDTLDYSSEEINQGSKVIFAACGEDKRTLGKELPTELKLPSYAKKLHFVAPGVLALEIDKFKDYKSAEDQMKQLCKDLASENTENFPLIIVVDDAKFCAQKENNFLWITFTRSNPSHDIYGINEFTRHKHWGCEKSLLIDARIKPFHAPPLVEDPKAVARVNELCAEGQSLHGVIKQVKL